MGGSKQIIKRRENRIGYLWSSRAKLPKFSHEQHPFLCETCSRGKKQNGMIFCRKHKQWIESHIVACRFYYQVPAWLLVTQ